jgi:hypothetical protein
MIRRLFLRLLLPWLVTWDIEFVDDDRAPRLSR